MRATMMREVQSGFDRLWSRLFTSPIHLDSALAKEPAELRAELARIVPAILRAPVSIARARGVALEAGEPWSLPPDRLKTWAPARRMAERMLADDEAETVVAAEADYPPPMIEEWERAYGAERARSLAAVLGAAPPLSIRIS